MNSSLNSDMEKLAGHKCKIKKEKGLTAPFKMKIL